MNATTKLSLATACLLIADKLGSTQHSKQEAVARQTAQNENASIASLTERYLAAANLLRENYRLRDQQEQEVRKAILLIKDSQRLALNQNKLVNLELAKERIMRIYNSVK